LLSRRGFFHGLLKQYRSFSRGAWNGLNLFFTVRWGISMKTKALKVVLIGTALMVGGEGFADTIPVCVNLKSGAARFAKQ
jgi:hypothetical protein